MGPKRRDLHKAKLRRDRIRREKHAGRAGADASAGAGASNDQRPEYPVLQHPFAAERHMRGVHALLEGQKFNSVDEVNARLEQLTRGGRFEEVADAWKRDDPKWRAQQLAYDALETDDFVEAMQLIHEALGLDPDCTDARRLMVSLIPAEPDNKIHLMREVVDKAEKNLGEEFFRENMGRFWGEISTRPYMRAKQHLGELLAETGNPGEAIVIFERMLVLNPGDNQGIRFPLLAMYLAENRAGDANRVMSISPDEEKFSGSIAWARVLERWLAGNGEEAGDALARARKVNPFVESYILGTRKIPLAAPEYYRPGDDSEAQTCAKEFAAAWQSHPGFGEWLRTRTV